MCVCTWVRVHECVSECVYMCVCAWVCLHECVYAWVYVIECMYMCACMCMSMCMCVHECVHVCAWLCTCVFMSMCVCTSVCMCIIMCALVCVHMRVYMYVCAWVCVHECVCISVCVYACVEAKDWYWLSFSIAPLLCFLRQGFTLNLGLTNSKRSASQQIPRISPTSSFPTQAWATIHRTFTNCWGLNSDLHAWVTSIYGLRHLGSPRALLFNCTLHRQTPAILLCKWIQQFLLDPRPMREILKYCFFSTTTQKAQLGPISLFRGLGSVSFILTYFGYRYWGLNPGCHEINTLVLLAITIKPSLYQGFF